MKNDNEDTPSMTRRAPLRASVATIIAALACTPGTRPPPAGAEPAPTRTAGVADAREVNRRIMSRTSPDSTATRPADRDEYRVGPEDLLDVDVFNVAEFSGSYRVDPSGQVAIPLLGPVAVAGLSARELEDTLEARLAATYVHDPHVTVRIAEMRSHGVSVIGAVNRPGVYQVPGRSTLLEVLAQAEGLSPDAGNQAFILRSGRGGGVPDHPPGPADSAQGRSAKLPSPDSTEQVLAVDLGALIDSGRPAENVIVRSGDIVQVRPAGLVYVVGEVNRPGGFTVPPGRPMTVLQALAMAQGLGGYAAADRGMIVREHQDGTREEVPVDLDAVLDGSEAPPELMAHDVLFVPKNGTKAFALGAVDALVGMVTFRGLVY